MASSSAAEVFSSPEATNAGGGALIGGAILGPTGALMGGAAGAAGKLVPSQLDPFKAGADIAREQDARFDDAFEKAKNLETTVEDTGTSSVTGGTSQTSKTEFAPKSAAEQALLDQSIANFGRQGALVDSAEAAISGRGGIQSSARDTLGGIMSGQAFDLTKGEQARIDRLRQADIDIGSNAINALLTERLGEVSADAARRGVRGQAFSQLQGDALGEAAKSLERRTLDANRNAAEQAIALPGQRAGLQASTAGGLADFQDLATQQAIKNRQDLQDPVALQQMLDERLKGGTTTSSGKTNQTTTQTGKQVSTGQGAVNILAAKAGAPGKEASGMATGMGAIGTLADIAGTVAKVGAGGA